MDQASSNHENEPWIRLTEKKQFSRLLYTNPVCFLSTIGDSPGRNVMVLSWLTATSNEGTFMCSINRRRHTASVLRSGVLEFVLSVPIMGMETLVLDVGRASGRWGSKFPQDHDGQVAQQVEVSEPRVSKRQAKKRSRMSLNTLGIPGLEAVPFGNQSRTYADDMTQPDATSQPFAIRGTVAHLKCSIYKRLDDVIDDDHMLILGRVTAAYVNSSYWDSTRNIFRPDLQQPPYLTFLGSQEFGYAVTRTTY